MKPLRSRSHQRKRVRQTFRLLPLLGCVGALIIYVSLFTTPKTLAESITPFAADAFVDSVGVVTHLGYTDTPYAQNWGKEDQSQDIRSLLGDLGVRHVRDGVPHPTLQLARAYIRPRVAQLYRDYGIKFITLPDIRTNEILAPQQLPPYIDEYANGTIDLEGETFYVRDLLEAIEGPNEYDKHNSQKNRDPNWVQNLKNYQSELYRQVKANPKLAQLPVIMPSLIYTQYCSDVLGSFKGTIDVGNLHSYPSYPYFTMPTSNLGWHLGNGKNCYGDKPVYVTETGYQTGGKGINNRTIAKYTSRLIPEYFSQSQIKRTYLYSLVDTLPENGLWGLIRPERNGQKDNGFDQFTLTPKPSYYAVKSLLELLREGTWVKSRRQWVVPSVNLKAVDITFEGKKDSTHHLLLQKSNGDYFLLLWQEVESFNPEAGNFDPPKNDVSISLNEGYLFTELYNYDANFKLQATSINPTRRLTVQVPDQLMVLRLSSPESKAN